MSKHTPGPWLYAFDGGTTAFITEADGSTIICIRTTENTTAHRNLEANARLMATAPELFASLLEMEEMFRGYADTDPATQAMFDRALTALHRVIGDDDEDRA